MSYGWTHEDRQGTNGAGAYLARLYSEPTNTILNLVIAIANANANADEKSHEKNENNDSALRLS